MQRLSFGMFYNIDSPIHRMDPRVKIHLFIAYAVAAFLIDGPLGMLAMAALLAVAVGMSRIPVIRLLGTMRGCWIVFLFPLLFNLFIPEGNVLASAGFITITDLGVYRAVFFTVRLVLVFTAASLMMLTISALRFCDAAEYLMKPFSKLGAPTEDISMIVSIAVRFIPTMGEEFATIRNAQAARGAVFDQGGPIRRAKALIPVLAPLLVATARRTENLAMAMESRCYGCGRKRTRYRQLKTRPSDWVAIVVMAVFLVAAIIWL